MAGTHNMWSAFGESVNTYFVPLQEQVGAENVVDVAKRLGIKFRSTGTPENPGDTRSPRRGPRPRGAPSPSACRATTPLDLANA